MIHRRFLLGVAVGVVVGASSVGAVWRFFATTDITEAMLRESARVADVD